MRHGRRCDSRWNLSAGAARPRVSGARQSGLGVLWHGHNDRGLALANAITEADAGAHIVSGAFLGIGERTGNTSLEQMIMYLYRSGSSRCRVDKIPEYCRKLAAYTQTAPPDNAPLVGGQAFATCTGTHAAAMLKARALGVDFEDLVVSSVPASALGRRQDVLIGPTSGLANARYVLDQLGIPATDGNARRLLEHAKSKDRWMAMGDVERLFASIEPTVAP